MKFSLRQLAASRRNLVKARAARWKALPTAKRYVSTEGVPVNTAVMSTNPVGRVLSVGLKPSYRSTAPDGRQFYGYVGREATRAKRRGAVAFAALTLSPPALFISALRQPAPTLDWRTAERKKRRGT